MKHEVSSMKHEASSMKHAASSVKHLGCLKNYGDAVRKFGNMRSGRLLDAVAFRLRPHPCLPQRHHIAPRKNLL